MDLSFVLLGVSLSVLALGLVYAARGGRLTPMLLLRPSPESLRQRPMRVIARDRLTPQHAIHLVRVGNRLLLIGTSGPNCTLLLNTNALEGEEA